MGVANALRMQMVKMDFKGLFSKKEKKEVPSGKPVSELKGSKFMENFVSSHKGMWKYSDFKGLANNLAKRGYEVDQDTLMSLLEEERENYLGTLMEKELKTEEKQREAKTPPAKVEMTGKKEIPKPEKEITKEEELKKSISELNRERKEILKEIDYLKKRKLDLNKELMSTKSGLVGEKKNVEEDKVHASQCTG